MLSILIPIYNQDIRPLVFTLAKQCNKLNINYQILCFDDCSDQKYKDKNKELAFIVGINYTELPENLGRSKIRNWLGKASQYDYLLFLDGDSKVRNKDFIKNYIKAMPGNQVIYGGRIYQKNKPANIKKILHWKYGTYVESMDCKKRQKSPYLNFMSNNFLIAQEVFNQCLFDEKTVGYGYEDLQYAYQLEKLNIPILHINNPVYHDGIEINSAFLSKTKQSIQNLIKLEKIRQVPQTRLMSAHKKLVDWGLENIFLKMYGYFKNSIEKNLLSKKPLLILLQLWKLHFYIHQKHNKL
ncbi:MAG: glycosyltransferase family 2 protein [Saprospiraceae bacterium]|nr:glycosyltransferase family 2 protein [Saprospiraceae bacterium]